MLVTVSVLENVKLKAGCRSHEIVTDQPRDEGGSDAGMTPLELLGASLASCIAYYVVKYCHRHQISASKLKVDLDWTFAENPHRVGVFDVKIRLPQPLSDRDRRVLIKIAQSCTVHNTLSHTPTINMSLE